MFSTVGFFTVLGVLLALGATVCTYIFVLPEGKIKTTNKFFSKLFSFARDLFSFKELYLEKILQALYILATIACITVGAMMLFGFSFWENWSGDLKVEWTGGYGLLLMIGGPIAVRLAFEVSMMFVLLVKNVIQINSKLKADTKEIAEKAEEPAKANTAE
ncbi:MAG: hypothetical protein IJ298_01995 [Ruminococcus sp.]|nr:hypothetical protein [Ruminococcus sp.]